MSDHRELSRSVAGLKVFLTGAASGEQGTGAIRGQPFQAFDVASLVEIALGVEVGDRERQQAGGEDGFQFLWSHCCRHPVALG